MTKNDLTDAVVEGETKSAENLSDHLQERIQKKKPKKRPVKGEFRSKLTTVRKHKKEAHSKEVDKDTEEKNFVCKVCGIICDNKIEHTSHLENAHGAGRANTCPLCLVVLEDRVKR